MLVGWFPPPPETSLDELLAEALRWWENPGAFAALEYPRCCVSAWRWETDREDLSVWFAGRMLALVSRGPDGRPVVARFDRPAAE